MAVRPDEDNEKPPTATAGRSSGRSRSAPAPCQLREGAGSSSLGGSDFTLPMLARRVYTPIFTEERCDRLARHPAHYLALGRLDYELTDTWSPGGSLLSK